MRTWTVARRELKALLICRPATSCWSPSSRSTPFSSSARRIYRRWRACARCSICCRGSFSSSSPRWRALAEDIRGGQLEVVLAQPLSELELLLGKYLASVLFLCIALALSGLIPLGLSLGAAMPWPTVIAQYVGAGLLAAGFAGIGTWASSLTRSQITAFILAPS